MPEDMPCIAIVPARYASSRFPGKPLTPLLGKPMFWHVVTRTQACPEIDQTYLATDDERIVQAARTWNIPVITTSPEHTSGTDRILEAAQSLNLCDDTVVVNVQGDEPCISVQVLVQLVQPLRQGQVQVSTVARPVPSAQAEDPNLVKVVRATSGQALYFSRSPIPYAREGGQTPFLGHIGLYAFRLSTLRFFHQLGPSPLESIEKLEQLRFLEAGVPIHVVLTSYRCYGVDRPEDVAKVEAILREEHKQCAHS